MPQRFERKKPQNEEVRGFRSTISWHSGAAISRSGAASIRQPRFPASAATQNAYLNALPQTPSKAISPIAERERGAFSRSSRTSSSEAGSP
jgi:hypothetical protein